MAYNSDVRTQIQIPESGKFVEIVGDSRFPQISVNREYPNGSVETAEFSKYAVLTHMVNASDISISLSSSNLNIGNVGVDGNPFTAFHYGSGILSGTKITITDPGIVPNSYVFLTVVDNTGQTGTHTISAGNGRFNIHSQGFGSAKPDFKYVFFNP